MKSIKIFKIYINIYQILFITNNFNNKFIKKHYNLSNECCSI